MTERHEIWKFVDGIQMDLRAAQAKMVSLRSFLSSISIPENDSVDCPRCGIPFRGQLTLAEHLYRSHDGPEPAHWLELDLRTLEPVVYGKGDGRIRKIPSSKEVS